MKDVQQKNCLNCGNYIRHYAVIFGGLSQVGGHCSGSIKNKTKNTAEGCQLWTPLEEREESQKNYMISTLKRIDKNVKDILDILKNDLI